MIQRLQKSICDSPRNAIEYNDNCISLRVLQYIGIDFIAQYYSNLAKPNHELDVYIAATIVVA